VGESSWRFKSSHPHQAFKANPGTIGEQTTADIDLHRLIRLRGTSTSLLAFLDKAGSGDSQPALDAVTALSNEISATIGEGPLLEEFNRISEAAASGYMMGVAKARAAMIDGWLQGLIDSLTFEAQRQAEAAAYAEARVKNERAVGFQAARHETPATAES
jgi:hypothetical protein